MKRREAIQEACSIVSLAYQAVGDYRYPSDGFCARCQKSHDGGNGFQNEGKALDFVRLAVVREILRRGLRIPSGFDPRTGKELEQ
jgi:hypothetical protein